VIRATVRENRLSEPRSIAGASWAPYVERGHIWVAKERGGSRAERLFRARGWIIAGRDAKGKLTMELKLKLKLGPQRQPPVSSGVRTLYSRRHPSSDPRRDRA
jgi:hypothetical protein